MAEDLSFIEKIKKNIDGGVHIKDYVQTQILNFNQDTIIIANKLSLINPDGVDVTQSKVWVPAIWNALKLCNVNGIPDDWLKIDIDINQEKISEFIIRLSMVEGWCEYTKYLLEKDYNDNTGNELMEKQVEDYVEKIKKEMTHLKKYLKYKQKYIKLKNNLNNKLILN